MKEHKFLLIESSGSVCSVAIANQLEVLGEKSIEEPNSHSTYLASFISDVLKETGNDVGSLSAVSISSGPGSYTGLRIGCSLAKGICYGANLPLIAVSTLKCWADAGLQSHPEASRIYSLIDARRMDAYMQVFDGGLNEVSNEEFVTLDMNSISKPLSKDISLVIGSGAKKWEEEFGYKGVIVDKESKLFARHMYKETIAKWENKSFEDVAYFEPNYIKSVFVTKT